jgi:hypothetical protein
LPPLNIIHLDNAGIVASRNRTDPRVSFSIAESVTGAITDDAESDRGSEFKRRFDDSSKDIVLILMIAQNDTSVGSVCHNFHKGISCVSCS